MSDGKKGDVGTSFGDAMLSRGDRRQEKLLKAADDLRLKMEALSVEARDLILDQPPLQLLAYMSAQFHMGVLSGLREQGEKYRPDKELIQKFQLALEYIHAVWACHTNLKDETSKLDEGKVGTLFETLDTLSTNTMMYCMASSAANLSEQSSTTEFHAKSSWVLMRGHRYQVLEREFFEYMLAPHDEALRAAYGMGASQIAEGVQDIADSMRAGMSEAAITLETWMEKNRVKSGSYSSQLSRTQGGS